MAYGTKAQFEAVRELAFGGISGTYAAVGTPVSSRARIIRFVNSTNADIYISLDGVTNHLRLSSSGFFLIDFSSNKIQDDGLFIAEGTQFYAKQVTAPTSGTVWIEVVGAIGGA
mgnify:CR=1 FL=1